MKRKRINKTKRMNKWAMNVTNWCDVRAFDRARRLSIGLKGGETAFETLYRETQTIKNKRWETN